MKVYTSYTQGVKDMLNLLQQSAEGLEDVEIVPCLFEGDADAVLGQTVTPAYQALMLKRWQMLPALVKHNIGSNIVWLDLDCVFNKNNKSFAATINSLLEDHDFIFQYDTNSGLGSHINTGIMGIKCSDKTTALVEQCVHDISNTAPEDRRGGYPLLEWNEVFSKYPDYEATYCILPQDFGYRTSDCVIYHAIGVQDKMAHLKDALSSFG
jgi:hypothetical protein